jgi:Tol biopolymer transport system component
VHRPVILLACGAALAVSAVAGASVRHGGVTANIYTVDVATDRLVMLTANRESDEDKLAYGPSWSPNMTSIVYAETRCHACASEVRVTHIHPLPAPLGRRIAFGFHPRWSPVGDTIAFVDPTGNIETVRADGSGRRVVARGGLANDDPAWSPDGRTLAISRQLSATVWGVFLVPARGGTARPLLHDDGQQLNPAWSPDGSEIAFAHRAASGRWQIETARVDGTHVQRLSDGSGSDSSPTWSPDGRRIAFVREVGPDGSALFVMRARGGPARRLTPPSLDAVQPQWAIRGSAVAFSGRVTTEH